MNPSNSNDATMKLSKQANASLRSRATLAALGGVLYGMIHAEAFANPYTSFISQSPSSLNPFRIISSLDASNHPDDTNKSSSDEVNPFTSLTHPLLSAAAPLVLSASLLFAPPVLSPTTQAIIEPANAATPTTAVSPTATAIDIDLKSLPSLTRKAIVNRDAISKYLIESAQSLQPILRILSESDTVTVTPPKDVKGAINSLLGGEAQFVINNDNLVDVRVESVPGVIIVRVINPNLPRLPFLKDGTAAMEFVDKIVDVAPKELERAAEEVQAIEKFLTWGAPETKPVTFGGSSLGKFLSSKFVYGGKTVSLGALGDLTNSEVVLGSLGVGIAGAYGASYAYYVYLREEAEKDAEEKKAAAAAKKKVKAAVKVEAPVVEKVEMKESVKEAKPEEASPVVVKDVVEGEAAPVDKAEVKEKEAEAKAVEVKYAVEDGYTAAAAASTATAGENAGSTIATEPPKKMRKRDAIKKIFGQKD
ncbi:hypothetical protein HJC23_000788 [Cyclotella cryptica]|uniref:Uncharacterized protein n=1 Tax=Cyclotella cryptica TaxID=29204 RepID=A0ABD3Q0V1_9STRA|eukprot:CCRYP_010178-RA/>CCRYP_010178-RA protein AED:0.10 eAED:0.10 QI:0/-1/0/1/-1/1/1/0/476